MNISSGPEVSIGRILTTGGLKRGILNRTFNPR
jgi:hypothetical protein